MNNKITLPALAAMLAQRTGLTKRLCEDFIRELFAQVSSSLADGESVKIKDLGTFRVSKVEPRMSVDVSTGEPIRIPGHYKVSFVPAKDLAIAVNSPFEAFEPVEVPDSVTELDLEQTISSDTEDNPAAIAEPATEPMPAPGNEPEMTSDSKPEPSSENEPEPEPETPAGFYEILPEDDLILVDGESMETPGYQSHSSDLERDDNESDNTSSDNTSSDDTAPGDTDSGDTGTCDADMEDRSEKVERYEPPLPVESTEKKDKPVERIIYRAEEEPRGHKFGIGFFVGFICCLILFGVAGLIGYKTLLAKIENLTPAEIPAIQVPEISEDGVAANDTALEPMTATSSPAPSASVDKEETSVPAKEMEPDTKPSDNKVYDTITRTRYLTTMAKEHYGNFNLWPYIYEENKDFLGHPDRIRPGTKVVVPPLSKYGVNPDSKADIEKARKLGAEIYAKYQ